MPGHFESMPFLKPVLRGGRFDTPSPVVPVEFLAEFAAYRALIVEVASALFREAHSRHRVPAGFEDSFQLSLAGIESGSTIPVLVRSVVLAANLALCPPELSAPGGQDIFDQARDRVAACVESVATTGKVPSDFPWVALRYFERFGERLKPGESIELRAPGSSSGPRYTVETKRLIAESRTKKTKPIVLVGMISGLDGNSRTFNLDVREPKERHYKRLPYRPEMHAALVACLAQFSDNPVHSQARIVGTATCDKSDKLTDIVEVTQVQPLDGAVTPVAVRIKQLRTLKAGWLDGAGKPPSDTSLDWLEQLLGQLPSDGSLPRPYLYPTPEGSVQAEWDIGPWSVTAEVDALNRRLAVSALNTQTQASHDYDIQAEHAEELVNFLKFLKTEPPSQLA